MTKKLTAIDYQRTPYLNLIRSTPVFKDLKFKDEQSFQVWLKQTTKKVLHFEDQGQDFLRWYVADNGEVIHCEPFQSSVWNGTQVLDAVINEQPIIAKGKDFITTLNYRVIKIERSL